jgi:hypothetical protein
MLDTFMRTSEFMLLRNDAPIDGRDPLAALDTAEQ